MNKKQLQHNEEVANTIKSMSEDTSFPVDELIRRLEEHKGKHISSLALSLIVTDGKEFTALESLHGPGVILGRSLEALLKKVIDGPKDDESSKNIN